jgi:hypothetical protein
VKELLHNPFLGSGHTGPHPHALETAGPSPDPWRSASADPARQAVALLIAAATAKETAAGIANKETAKQITNSAENAIMDALDDFCGTPPRVIPWPFPGPPPWVWEIASQLTAAANTLQEGSLRTSLIQISGRVIEKGLGQTKAAAAGARG